MTAITPEGGAERPPGTAGKVQMTDAMREGLDALQREYNAFVEAFETITLTTDRRTRSG